MSDDTLLFVLISVSRGPGAQVWVSEFHQVIIITSLNIREIFTIMSQH